MSRLKLESIALALSPQESWACVRKGRDFCHEGSRPSAAPGITVPLITNRPDASGSTLAATNADRDQNLVLAKRGGNAQIASRRSSIHIMGALTHVLLPSFEPEQGKTCPCQTGDYNGSSKVGKKNHHAIQERATRDSSAEKAVSAVYQCVKNGEHWHLTQEQSVPPPAHRGGAYTSCSKWAEFKLGYEKRRPTCPECATHVFAYEKKLRGTAFDWIDQIGEPPRDGATDYEPAPECPECESADTEDGGYSTLEYRCRSCGHRWEPK